jgi:hypothetical protein
MIKRNWVDILNDRFIAHGISLSTEESILLEKENRKAFNSVLRDLKQMFPTKKLWHMVLSMHNHYAIEFIVDELLDMENRLDIEVELANETGRKLTKKLKRN